MIYRPTFRLVLSSLESLAPMDAERAYAVILDPSSPTTSGIYFDGLPWDSPYIQGPPPKFMAGSLGLISLRTQETMQGHSASLSITLGAIGGVLRPRVLPHDPLRIEILSADGRWTCAFDGNLSGVQWTRASSADSYRWRLDITAAGLQKVLSEQWLDWQGFVQAEAGKNFPGTAGFSFFHELAKQQGAIPVSDLMRMFISGAVDKFLDFGVRGARAASGTTFQFSPNPRDWQSAWGLFVFATENWYLMKQGPIWGILQGLAEPDVHEFFLTYQPDPNASEYREIPTLVFRPRPWPGPPAAAVTAKVTGAPVDDDSIWRQLDVVMTGVPTGPGAALRVGSSRSDASRANTFFVSLSGAQDSNPTGMSYERVALGFRMDDNLIKRYGFSSRQVSIGSYLKADPSYFDVILPSVLDRVAWQEAPLPFLLDQVHDFPLMPGIHIGSVLEDYSENASLPSTGYVISVSHSISGSPKGLQAQTSVGITRGLDGVTADQYPAAVRALVDLKMVTYMTPTEVKAARADWVSSSHFQPAEVNPLPGPDNLLATSTPQYQDQPTDAVKANLAILAGHIFKVRNLLGNIIITSAYRSVKLNAYWGGVPGSAHTKGLAFDFQVPGGSGALTQAFSTLTNNAASLGYRVIVFETRSSDGVQWIHYEIPAAGAPATGEAKIGRSGD